MIFKIACVNYLNTIPFVDALGRIESQSTISTSYVHPGRCLELFINNKVDIALIPVAGLSHKKNVRMITNYGIASHGVVKTVALFANKSINDIDTIVLDRESTTSVALLKILLRHYWKKDVILKSQKVNAYQAKPNEAVLMIGDKSIDALKQYTHIYDLGEIWNQWTDNGSFVYAAWVANDSVSDEMIDTLNKEFTKSISILPKLLNESDLSHSGLDIHDYYTHNITFELTVPMRQRLQQFLLEL